MSLASSALKAGGLGGPGIGAIGAGAAAAGALAGGAEKQKGWFVPDGFEAVRTRFGRAVIKNDKPVVHGPGFHPTMPFSHSNKFVSIQNRVSDLGDVPIERNNQLTVVHARATWGVVDSYKAWIKVKEGELEQSFSAICGNGLRIVMSTVPVDRLNEMIDWDAQEDVIDGYAEITDEILEENVKLNEILERKKKLVRAIHLKTSYVCAEELDEIGLEIRGISIKTDAPHPFETLTASGLGRAALVAITTGAEDAAFPHEVNGSGLIPVAGA